MESNHTTNNLHYEIALSLIEGIGSVHFKTLVTVFGSAKEVLTAPKSKLLKVSGIGDMILKGLASKKEALEKAEKIIKDSAKLDINILHLNAPDYPETLKNIFDSPPILYTKGKGNIKTHKTLAIVGTRDATDYGKKVTEDLVSQLKDNQIISGLAYGIDITAHKAALENNLSTLAVLANSLDTVYPSSHQKIANEIQENGLLISEQPPFTKLHPQFFISRNRIIAALSQATLVVESSKKGGSMVTAEFANNYNKDVFAVPGDIYKKQAEGTLKLIFQNKAHIYTSPSDFIEWMDWNKEPKKQKRQIDLSLFTEDEAKVVKLLSSKDEMLIDEISWQCQISLNKLSSILLNLEFQDVIKQTPGKKFKLTHK